MSTPEPTTIADYVACQHLVSVVRWLRCGLPEDSPIHDPLGPAGRHPYDPTPTDAADTDAALAALDNEINPQ